jgi:Protein of unknown function (DUF3168)
MSDNTISVLTAVRNALLANSSLVAIVGQKIYSRVPQNLAFPFIKISSNQSLNNTINTQKFNHLVRIQAWSDISLEKVIEIRSLVYNILHRQQLTLTGSSRATCQVNELIDAFLEDDNKTYQSIIEFKITTTK